MSRVVLACLVGGILAISCDQGEDHEEPTVLAIEDVVDSFDESFCQRLIACDCEEEWQPTQQECRAQIDSIIDQWRQDGESHGLAYDGSCLGATLDALDEQGCDPVGEPDEDAPDCVAPCRAYHGMGRVGDACTQYDIFDDCAQGLMCAIDSCDEDCTGTCRAPCERAEIGESCDEVSCVEGADCDYETRTCRSYGSEGDSCSNVRCREDLVCDSENNRCIVLPSVGDPCFQSSCEEGAFCVTDPVDPTVQTCTAPGALDESCMGHRQCESGYCPAGFCKELPGKGDECFGTCAEGLSCTNDDETLTCKQAPAAVCNISPI